MNETGYEIPPLSEIHKWNQTAHPLYGKRWKEGRLVTDNRLYAVVYTAVEGSPTTCDAVGHLYEGLAFSQALRDKVVKEEYDGEDPYGEIVIYRLNPVKGERAVI